MKPVARYEIVDIATYERMRGDFRREVMKVKATRRLHIGEYLTLLFENHITVLYQIQEMMRAERMVREPEILHEVETYNELLGKEGELGCTLLIEIDDPTLRNEKLQQWWNLPEKICVVLEDGARVQATFDERQRGDGRLSSVQYLKFNTGGQVPVAVQIDLDNHHYHTPFTDELREALRADLVAGFR
jgi:hypothetical protein